jgi:hypothetical protein
MKKLLILATMLLMVGLAKAQKVYSVDCENQADVKVGSMPLIVGY